MKKLVGLLALLFLFSTITAAQTTWTSRATPLPDNDWTAVAYGNGVFVAVAYSGTGNRVMTSPDGIIWTSRTSAADNDWIGVTYGNGVFVAVAASGTGNRVMTSPDGIIWTSRTSAADNDWIGVTYSNGLFVAVAASGTGNRVMTSPDGITWTSRTSAADNRWYAVAYGNGLFVAVSWTGTGNRVMTSPDGITWTSRTSAADNGWQSVTYGNGVFVAVADSGTGNRVMTSPDGITWTSRTSATDNDWFGVAYGNGAFVAVAVDGGTGNRVMSSRDGITWTSRTSAADNAWFGVAYGNGVFAAVAATGIGNRVMTGSPAVLTANPTYISMASSYPAGAATGFTLQTGEPGLAFTVSPSASSAGWLTVSPTSGITPTPITVTLDPGKAIPGTYSDSIVISSPGVASVSVPVKMSVSGIIKSLRQQVNAATQAGPDYTVAPNEIVSLYLTNFSCATAPVVSINGTAVSWSSYAPGQINYAVPANITSPAALTVACNGTTAWTFNGLTTAAVVPGIFTLTGTGKGQAAVVNSDGTINGGTNPATRGSWLSVYGTGFGVFNAAGTNGLRTVAGAVTATIGGVDATVLYAGNTPGATDGLQQFNLQIPAGVTAGTAVPIVLTVNGTPTQTTATVSLK